MFRLDKIATAYLFSGVMMSAGISLSLLHHDWEWFARSGSLVVVAGILLTSWQLIENARRLGMRYPDSGHDWAETAESRKRVRKQIKDEIAWQNERYGLYLLIGGTLVWGLGDLVNLI